MSEALLTSVKQISYDWFNLSDDPKDVRKLSSVKRR